MVLPKPVVSEAQRTDMLLRESRYQLLAKIASGGMASVYLGRIRGAVGFWRLVAIKRAHAHLVDLPGFKRTLIAEASLASKIHHPNVVPVLDVEEFEDELLLVMEYVEGATLFRLVDEENPNPLPPPLVIRIILDACAGLHAAHTLVDEAGKPLNLIHRDVSPQNIIVGADGLSRLTDFGIAKCSETSRGSTGILKGKAGYMAPEYVDGHAIDRRVDVFALGVVLWEALARRRLFEGRNQADTLRQVVNARIPALSSVVPEVGAGVSRVVAKALERSAGRRFQDAQQFGMALEEEANAVGMVAPHAEVGAYASAVVGEELSLRRQVVQQVVTASEAEVSATEAPSRVEGPGGPSQPDADADSSTFAGSGTVTGATPVRRGRWAWVIAGTLSVIVGIFVVANQRTNAPEVPPVTQPLGVIDEPHPTPAGSIGVVSAEPSVSAQIADAGVPKPPEQAEGPAETAPTARSWRKARPPTRVPNAASSPPPAPSPPPAALTPSEPDKAPPNPYGDAH